MTNPSDMWTGKFGPFTSTFNPIKYNVVNSLPLNETGAINIHFVNRATVPCGGAAAACTMSPSSVNNNWLVTVSNNLNDNTGAHEAANVMGEQSRTAPVGSANNITRWVHLYLRSPVPLEARQLRFQSGLRRHYPNQALIVKNRLLLPQECK
jgi:hypothetical protein